MYQRVKDMVDCLFVHCDLAKELDFAWELCQCSYYISLGRRFQFEEDERGIGGYAFALGEEVWFEPMKWF